MLTSVFRTSLAVAALVLANSTSASLLVTGTIPSSVTFELTNPVSFNHKAGSFDNRVRYLVFNDWVTSDGSPSRSGSFTGGSNSSFGSIGYLVNTEPVVFRPISGIVDNNGATTGDLTPGDGYIEIRTGFDFESGDTVTFPAQSWTFDFTGTTNPQIIQRFNGGVFLTNSSFEQISELSIVPEASNFVSILGVFSLCMAVSFRRRITLKTNS
jgi:hypothetical protein